MKRRDAIRVIGSTAVLVTILPELARAKKLALGLDKVEQLKKVGGWVVLKIKGQEIMFIRESEEVIRALDPICTHKHCTVDYDPDEKLIVCPCHGSTYDLEGKVLKGPAKKPLTVYDAKLSDGKIIFSMD